MTVYFYWLSSTDAEFKSLSAHVSVEAIEFTVDLKSAENRYNEMKDGGIYNFYYFFIKYRNIGLEYEIIRREIKFYVDWCTAQGIIMQINHEIDEKLNSFATWKVAPISNFDRLGPENSYRNVILYL